MGRARLRGMDTETGKGFRGPMALGVRAHRGTRGSRGQAGFSLLEVVVAISMLVVVLLAFTRVTISSSVATATAREASLARESAREVVERLQAASFSDAFALYNLDGADDPDGANTAPGSAFVVDGLTPLDADPDGIVGEIVFPTLGAAPGVLREDLQLPFMGLPTDLNGDGVVDDQDHSGDYLLLPALVRVQWQSPSGPAKFEFKTLLGNY